MDDEFKHFLSREFKKFINELADKSRDMDLLKTPSSHPEVTSNDPGTEGRKCDCDGIANHHQLHCAVYRKKLATSLKIEDTPE